MGQFDWTPEVYLERIRAEIPGYDELQDQAVAAIPFPPERVLELGMGTGETTRRLIEAHPDAWVVGLDASPDMVFRARQTYDDVQLARIEDPLAGRPLGPRHLGPLRQPARRRAAQDLFRRSRTSPAPWSSATSSGRIQLVDGVGQIPGGKLRSGGGGRLWHPGRARGGGSSPCTPDSTPATIPRLDGRPEEENFQRASRQAARQSQGGKARLNSCPRCHSPRLPHRVCPTCGTYAGREVITHKVADAPAAPLPTPSSRGARAARDRRPRRLRRGAGIRGPRRGRQAGRRRRHRRPRLRARAGSSGSTASRASRSFRPPSGSATTRTRCRRCGRRRRPRSCAPPRDVAEAAADAMVSRGSTGATMAAATFGLRRLKGVQRPALAVQVPVAGQTGALPRRRRQRRGPRPAPGPVRLPRRRLQRRRARGRRPERRPAHGRRGVRQGPRGGRRGAPHPRRGARDRRSPATSRAATCRPPRSTSSSPTASPATSP